MYVLLSGMDLNDPKWEIDEKSTSDCEASQKNVSLSDKYEQTLHLLLLKSNRILKFNFG